MQNQELSRTQAELALTRVKYAEVYDFAPVGYASVTAEGRDRRSEHDDGEAARGSSAAPSSVSASAASSRRSIARCSRESSEKPLFPRANARAR